jgi:hypothetical protein
MPKWWHKTIQKKKLLLEILSRFQILYFTRSKSVSEIILLCTLVKHNKKQGLKESLETQLNEDFRAFLKRLHLVNYW